MARHWFLLKIYPTYIYLFHFRRCSFNPSVWSPTAMPCPFSRALWFWTIIHFAGSLVSVCNGSLWCTRCMCVVLLPVGVFQIIVVRSSCGVGSGWSVVNTLIVLAIIINTVCSSIPTLWIGCGCFGPGGIPVMLFLKRLPCGERSRSEWARRVFSSVYDTKHLGFFWACGHHTVLLPADWGSMSWGSRHVCGYVTRRICW